MPGRLTALGTALLVCTIASGASAQERRSVIKGTVVATRTLVPVLGARVALVGAGRSMVTDSLGQFFFDSLHAGTYLLHVRGSTDETPMTEVPLGRREVVDLEVKLGQGDATVLPELAVTAPDAASADIDAMRLPREFTARRRSGLGQYLTRQEILERNPYAVSDLFRNVRGMIVSCRGGICLPRSVRGNCYPVVVVDQVPTDAGVLAGMVPGDLEAIEIYNGMSTVPAEYLKPRDRAQCGMIVVWTRVPPQKRPNQ